MKRHQSEPGGSLLPQPTKLHEGKNSSHELSSSLKRQSSDISGNHQTERLQR